MAAKGRGQVKFESWLKSVTDNYKKLTSCQRLAMLCRLVDLCSPSELYEYSNYVTDLFRRDFISLLPAELVDHMLSYVDHESLLRACCVGIRTYIKRRTLVHFSCQILLYQLFYMLFGNQSTRLTVNSSLDLGVSRSSISSSARIFWLTQLARAEKMQLTVRQVIPYLKYAHILIFCHLPSGAHL